MLEPYERKRSRTVLRRERASNRPDLADYTNICRALNGEVIYISENSKSHISPLENVNVNSRVVVYDMSKLSKQFKSFGMMTALENLQDRIAKNQLRGKRTRIYIDEIYYLIKNEQSANYLYELYKCARMRGWIVTSITQDVEDLLCSETGSLMFANCGFILLFSQSATDREKLAELLNIPEESMAYVTNAIAGSGLMLVGNYGIIPFKFQFPQNTELYKLMTTRLGEADNSEGKKNEGNSDKNTA